MPLSNIAEPIATGGFLNILIEAFCPESIKGLTLALDDINFDAPSECKIPAYPGLATRPG
jgi:hypothetical protein